MTKKCFLFTRHQCPLCKYVLTEEVIHIAGQNGVCLSCERVYTKDFKKVPEDVNWKQLNQEHHKQVVSNTKPKKKSWWKRIFNQEINYERFKISYN